MKYLARGLTGSALLIAVVAAGCKVEVGATEDEPGPDTETAGAAATTGGNATSSGGSSSSEPDASAGTGTEGGSAGASAAEDGGASMGGAAGGETTEAAVVEDCATDVNGTNDDAEHAVALGSQATLCLRAGDLDFVYIDAPAGDKASIARVLIAPEPGVSADFAAIADADGSRLGGSNTTGGADVKLALVLAPGSRTYLSLKPFVAGGIVVLTSSLEFEQDAFEPNNEKSQAASIAINTDITAQFHAAYASATDNSGIDWYRASLSAGPHTLRFSHVPDDIRLEVIAYDPNGGSLGSKNARTNGEIFDLPFNASAAGEYRFQLRFFVGGPPPFATGKEPASIADTYTFRVEE
jgi:hypothetical protein